MRSNGHDSKRRGGNTAGGRTSTKAANRGHGTDGSRGIGDGKVQPTSVENGSEPLKILFEPIDDECPGGVCPVPWATDTSGDNVDNTVKDLRFGQKLIAGPYIEKHREVVTDIVNHPPHYTDGTIECIEAIEAQLTPEEFRGHLKANCVKYIWRERHKGGVESLKKAQWYLNRLVDLQ